ncbi:MAG: lipoyl domain-containing protein [Bacteroidia bacterium]
MNQPIEIRVTRESANDDVVTVQEWHVASGAQVREGDIIVSLETSKTVMEVEAEQDGFVENFGARRVGRRGPGRLWGGFMRRRLWRLVFHRNVMLPVPTKTGERAAGLESKHLAHTETGSPGNPKPKAPLSNPPCHVACPDRDGERKAEGLKSGIRAHRNRQR